MDLSHFCQFFLPNFWLFKSFGGRKDMGARVIYAIELKCDIVRDLQGHLEAVATF